MSVFRIDDVMVCALSGWWCALSQAWREVQRRSVDALNVWRGVCLDDLPALTSDLVGLELGLQSRRGGGRRHGERSVSMSPWVSPSSLSWIGPMSGVVTGA